MRNNDRCRLLYNQLWVGTTSRIKPINPTYTYPKYLDLEPTVKTSLPVDIKLPPKVDTMLPVKPLILNTDKDLIKDWNVLVNQINNCTKCRLCAARKNVVIERGSRHAHWMFVGEGPGEQEDLQGLPFVGASGQLLDKMFLAMNLDKSQDVYVCNVVKCRPPYNRNPEVNEIEACKNYLFSQIDNIKPKIIITLGRFASQTLLNSSIAIGKLRNKVHRFGETPLIVTYHPSYLLRNPSAKKEAWADLQLAMRTYQ